MRHSSRAIAASNSQYASWIETRFADPDAPKQSQRPRSVGLALLKTRISPAFLALTAEDKVRCIKNAACIVYGLPLDTMDRKPKPGEVIPAKQIALYLCDQTTTLSYCEIAQFFCYRDHSSVGPKLRRMEELLMNPDQKTIDALVEICAQLESAT